MLFLQTNLDSGEWAFTQEECAVLRDKRIALINLFFENGDFGFYHTHLCDAHRDQAIYYAKINDEENALDHLRSAAEHAIKFISYANEENTSLIFCGREQMSFTTGNTDNEAQELLKIMENRVFDKIREMEEFIEIKENLVTYAGKWSVE